MAEKRPEVVLTPVSKGAKCKPSDFVHLHNHTQYSLLDGLTKIPDLIDFVKSTGMEAVAVTDHGTMTGLIELYKTAYEAGVKPILGLEAYVAARKYTDKDPSYDKERFHITLLAMNNKGYENLCRMMTEAEINGMYYKPRIDHDLMEKYNEGIICLSGCMSSEISVKLKEDDYEGAKKLVEWYSGVFSGRFYLEMQDHGHPESPTHSEVQNRINEGLQRLAKDTGLPLVVTCDGHYLKHEDSEAHEILLCIGTASNLSDPKRMTLKDFQLHVIPPQEILDRWSKDFPEAVRNTKRIAERCDVDLHLGRILIPKFPGLPKGMSEKEYLDLLVFRGLAMRYSEKTEEEVEKLSVAECRKLLGPEVLERIDYELSVVDKMNYNGYFLIVQDFINWGKKKRIVYGPGRGSAAGSLLAYALRITELDPLKYDLLFERFLNPDRISMPDIDTDIQDTRRDEVIQYCTEKYGRGRVSNIVTFDKMMGRMAVRDVARVLEVPYEESDRIAKLVPPPVMGHHVPLKEAISSEPDLKAEYENNRVAKEVIDFAIQLEGTIRGHGVHACGVVIAPDDLVKFLPLEVSRKQTNGEQTLAAQFPMTQIEELGLLKMDFLGLKNLTVINNTLRMVRKVYGKDIDMYELPLDDPETYALLQRAETTGVFQLESPGMKRYLKELKASRFEDIIAMVALYRPGPMQFIDSFIRRKHGKEEITYLHPGLEGALKDTYGILIYQEQFMQISRSWCGFTGGQADTLRKAVGKKKVKLMEEVKPQFIKGAVEVGGATEEIAETFWSQLLEFANYCFNKSHAACYALVAYWTAYLKAHFPDAFMAALMTSDMDKTDRLAIEIAECKRMGIKVLGPDINQSFGDFGIVKGEKTIRFGLSGIKSMGKALVEEVVIPEREKRGPFKSVYDFAERVNATKFNKRSWEAAIKTGAFDRFNDRSDLLYNLEAIQAYGQKSQKDKASGQMDLFAAFGEAGEMVKPDIKPAPTKVSDKEKLLWERDLMGLYLSAHPLDKYDIYFEEQCHPFSMVCEENDTKIISIGGIITNVRTILTKKNQKMAFVKIADKSGEQEIVVFPEAFAEYGAKLVQDNVIRCTGSINARDKNGNLTSDVKVLADTIEIITDEALANYQPTGEKIGELGKAKEKWRSKSSPAAVWRKNTPATPKTAKPAEPIQPPVDHSHERLWCLVKEPDNIETLNAIKQLCNRYAGMQEVILVLKRGDEKKPLKMPFRVSAEEAVSPLKELLGEDAVKIK